MRAREAEDVATVFAIVARENNLAIGTILCMNANDASRSVEIGYSLAAAYWGRGLMTEALRAWIHYGINHHAMHRLSAQTDPRNLASARLLVSFRPQ